jgi:hypothetical protein
MWPFRKPAPPTAYDVCRQHLGDVPPEDLLIVERVFPFRVRADLQLALDQILNSAEWTVRRFCGVKTMYHQAVQLSDCLTRRDHHYQPLCSPPQYQDVDIGTDQPVRCVTSGLWMLEASDVGLALLVMPQGSYGEPPGFRCELGGRNTEAVQQQIERLFRQLQTAVNESRCYRGKILSLERNDHDYSGQSAGITVHKLKPVDREQVILPAATLDLLDRNIINFVHRRPALAQRGLSVRKGLLFYGPPGTGKTHTIHYLSQALPGHTVLIITAEQVGLLDQYMTLARLLQPTLVVLEDVDLIARNRGDMESPCEEVLLNKLLNHMDGLTADAEILFVLTTNRPEMLEPALAGRPGRIDQAIEFPLPDAVGRDKLVTMYAAGVTLPDALRQDLVHRTEGVSAAFIKELLRRAYQCGLERGSQGELAQDDVNLALDELLFRGGSLNRTLLGANLAKVSSDE